MKGAMKNVKKITKPMSHFFHQYIHNTQSK